MKVIGNYYAIHYARISRIISELTPAEGTT
jgi:hypothetical protein